MTPKERTHAPPAVTRAPSVAKQAPSKSRPSASGVTPRLPSPRVASVILESARAQVPSTSSARKTTSATGTTPGSASGAKIVRGDDHAPRAGVLAPAIGGKQPSSVGPETPHAPGAAAPQPKGAEKGNRSPSGQSSSSSAGGASAATAHGAPASPDGSDAGEPRKSKDGGAPQKGGEKEAATKAGPDAADAHAKAPPAPSPRVAIAPVIAGVRHRAAGARKHSTSPDIPVGSAQSSAKIPLTEQTREAAAKTPDQSISGLEGWIGFSGRAP